MTPLDAMEAVAGMKRAIASVIVGLCAHPILALGWILLACLPVDA
jgi:hypothetical protein